MDETITILAGILAVIVIIDHCRRIYNEHRHGRMPVFDTLDIMMLVASIAVLLIIAAEIRTGRLR